MNPAEERERLRVVKDALDILAEGEPTTLAHAVPHGSQTVREAVRKVFKTLVEHGVLMRIAPEANGLPAKYHVKIPEALDALRSREEDIADLIWPGHATVEMPPEVEVTPPTPEPEQAPAEAPVSSDEKLDTMLRVLHTALTALVDIKGKVEAMEVKVNRLYAELTGEKG